MERDLIVVNAQAAPIKKPNRRLFVTVASVFAGLCAICLIVTAISNSTSSAAKPGLNVNSIQTSAVLTAWAPSTETAQALEAPKPKPSPMLTQTADGHAALRSAILQALGNGNRNVPRLSGLNFDDPEAGAIFVNWTIDDNLTNDMIVYGAELDATHILHALADSKIDYSYVILSGSFPMVDPYGNSKESNVVTLTFNKPTVDEINWQNFLTENICKIADQTAIWPQFRP